MTPSRRPGLVFDTGCEASLVLPLLFLALLQTVADGQTPSRDARPVRVWLGSSAVLTRGAPVRVYVQAAQDGHRENDIAIFAADINVAQNIVSDVPDEVGDPVQLGWIRLTHENGYYIR